MPGKTASDKLLIKPNSTLWLSDTSRASLLEPLPENVKRVDDLSSATTVAIFADGAESLKQTLAANRAGLARPAVLWIAYQKGNRAGLNRDTLWPILTPYGMRPVTQVAIDDMWSALRFRPLKPGETFNPGGN